MKKILSILCACALVFSLSACGEAETEVTNATSEAETEVASVTSETVMETTNIASYEGCQLELKDATFLAGNEGNTLIRVNATYTNNSTEPLYALCSFAVRAFQNDIELTDCSDINGDEETLIREIKSGASVEVSYVFQLSDNSDVEVLIGTPTADQETIGRQIYTVEKPSVSDMDSELNYECEVIQFNIEENDGSPRYSAIVGVTNTGNIPLNLGYSTFEVDDSQGNMIAYEDSSAIYAMPSIIYPGETGYYFGIRIELPENTSSTEEYKLVYETGNISVHSGDGDASTYETGDESFPEGDYSEIIGKVRGDPNVTVDILCILYDEQQNIITMGGTVTELDENGDGVFDITNWDAYGNSDICTYELIARKSPY